MNVHMKKNIENAILTSFLWSELYSDFGEPFLLDTAVFTHDNRAVANFINEVTQGSEKYPSYGILSFYLEQTMPHKWLELSEQTPLPFSSSKKYHEALVKDRNMSLVAGAA